MGKKSKRRENKAARPPSPAVPPGWERPALVAVMTLLFLALPLLPWHPLFFLPAVLYWPLYLGAIAGWWLHLVRDRGWFSPPEEVIGRVMESAGLILAFGAFLLLKLVGFHPSGTDENIYYYMAARMADGAIPYRDFFFSHPPVHLLVPTTVFGVLGFSVGVANAIPVVAQALAGLFLYLTIRPSSKVLAFVVLVLHFTTYQVLMGSTDMNGENLMTAFLMAALFAAVRGRFFASGLLAGLALGCGLYGLAGVLALAIAAAFHTKKSVARYSLGFAAGFGGVMIPFVILGGSGFVEGVFSYHMAKPVKGGDRVPLFGSANPFAVLNAFFNNLSAYLSSKGFGKSLYFHAPGYLAALLAMALILGKALVNWWRPDAGSRKEGAEPWYRSLTPRDLLSGTPEGTVKIAVLVAVLFLLEYSALNEFYDFYAVPMLSLLSVPAAYTLYRMYLDVREARSPKGLAVPVTVAVLFALHGAWAAHLNRSLWPQEISDTGKVVEYDWREPWVLPALSALSRHLFFVDKRVKGDVTPYYRHFVWNKRLTFSTLDDIADHIRANSTADETITGASTIAPLVALRADRRMAADEADTNSKRFKSGVLTEKEFFEAICSDNVRYIVSAPRSKFTRRFMQANPFIGRYFTREREFVDHQLNHFRDYHIALYRRVDVNGLPAGRVCEPQ